MAAGESYAIYKHYKSIWKEIDNNNMVALSNHPHLGTRINEKERGLTPLFLACMRKNYDIIHFLLQWGADPNVGMLSYSIVVSYCPLSF